MRLSVVLQSSLFVAAACAALPAWAYVGPGAGLTAIGSLLALLSAVVLALVGFIWYPVKRLLRKRRQAAVANEPQTARREAADKPDPAPAQDR